MVNFEKEAKINILLLIGPIVLGLVAAIILPNYIACADCGGRKNLAAQAQIQVLSTALESYKRDVGTYPTTEQGLQALRVKPEGATGWDGPYLSKDISNDPWGRPYLYKFPGKTPGRFEIVSYGGDGIPGGEGYNADIFNE